ncbi:uncharacterized, partial [Tachysurus ichikawai]
LARKKVQQPVIRLHHLTASSDRPAEPDISSSLLRDPLLREVHYCEKDVTSSNY